LCGVVIEEAVTQRLYFSLVCPLDEKAAANGASSTECSTGFRQVEFLRTASGVQRGQASWMSYRVNASVPLVSVSL